MSKLALFGTGIVVGYVLRSKRNQTLHSVACRIVDALFQPYDN